LWFLTEVLWGFQLFAARGLGSTGVSAVRLWVEGGLAVLWFEPLLGGVVWALLAGVAMVWLRLREELLSIPGKALARAARSGPELGGLPVTSVEASALKAVWGVDTQDAAWSLVRLRAKVGDCFLKVLLSDYVEFRGGGVSDVAALEQALMTDAALSRLVQARKGGWWCSVPAHMRGKASATLVEATWGLVWTFRFRQGSSSDGVVQKCFEQFLYDVAASAGYCLSSGGLRPVPVCGTGGAAAAGGVGSGVVMEGV